MKTIGLPKMIAPKGYIRDFSPAFVLWLSSLTNLQILVEEDFGSDFEYEINEYKTISNLKVKPRKQVLKQSDIILSITCPNHLDIRLMHPNALLISMLHYETHPERNTLLRQNGISAISLDSIQDFENKRLVEDYRSTAWNAVTEGFIQLRKLFGDRYWFNPHRKPIGVYVIGFGQLGQEAASAAFKMGNTPFQNELITQTGNPLVNVVPATHLHSDYKYHRQLFKRNKTKNRGFPDILIDTSKRGCLSKHILTEEDINMLPDHCVIVDITADRYEKSHIVKGIQGIPTGNESKYVFMPNDSAWKNKQLIPTQYQLSNKSQRVVVSNYAWPSYGTKLSRIANMRKYEYQLHPIIKLILDLDLKTIPQATNEWSLENAIIKAILQG